MSAFSIMQRDRKDRTFLLPGEHHDHRECDKEVRDYAECWREKAHSIVHYPGLSAVRFPSGKTIEFWRSNQGERQRHLDTTKAS